MIARLLFPLALLIAFSTWGPSPAVCAPGGKNLAQDIDLFRSGLERRISRHPFFKKVNLEWVWTYDEFVVIVQKPTKTEPGYVEKVAKLRSARSQVMNLRLREGLAQQWGLHRRPTAPRLIVIVLATERDFGNYFQVRYKQRPGGITSSYDPLDRLLVVCETPFAGASSARKATDLRMLERHNRALQAVHGYGSLSATLPGPYWFQQGLATEVSGNNDRKLAKKNGGRSQDWSYHVLSTLLQDPVARVALLQPLQTLFEQKDFRSVAETCKLRATAARVEVPHPWYCNTAYEATAGALFHYLTFDAGDDVRAKMKTFSEQAMKGKLKATSSAQLLQDFGGESLEVDFWTHVWKQHMAAAGKEEIDAGALAAFLRELGGGPIEAGGVSRPFDPSTLLNDVPQGDMQLNLALACMLSGDSQRAIELLDSALEGIPEGKLKERFQTERGRIVAWVETRDGYLQHLQTSNKKLVVDWRGERLTAAIEKVELGRIFLASNNRDLESLAIRELDPVEIARRMTDRRAKYDGGWAAAYPLVLDPSTKAARWLKGEAPDMAALAAHNLADYPARQDFVAAAGHLLALAKDPSKSGEIELAARLGHLQRLLALRDEVPFVTRMDLTLFNCAKLELAREFKSQDPAELLAGQVQVGADGQVHLVYEFDNPDELSDWVISPACAGDEGRWPDTKVAEPYLEIRKGKLVGSGQLARTHVLALFGAQTVIWKQRAISGGSVGADQTHSLRISVCGSAGGGYAGAYDSLDMEIYDPISLGYAYERAKNFVNYFDTLYERKIEYDGELTVSCFNENKLINSVRSAQPLSGAVQISMHTDFVVEITRIELRGQLGAGSMDLLRERWVAEQLVELGYK